MSAAAVEDLGFADCDVDVDVDGGDDSILAAAAEPPSRFDAIVTALEACVMSGDAPLQPVLEAWCRARCAPFLAAAAGGEHPLAFTALFNEYTALVEARLGAALAL